MSRKFSITHAAPEGAADPTGQPDAAVLSPDELRTGLLGRVAMVVDGDERVVLEDAPVIGVLADLVESLLWLDQGALSTELVDFYGEYRLVFEARGAMLGCEDEVSGRSFEVPAAAFCAATEAWCRELLGEIEAAHARILRNPSYLQLKERIEAVLRELR